VTPPFLRADLSGARFVGADLSGVVMRGVEVPGAEIDAEEPARPRIPGDSPVLPATDSRRGVGAPPLRRARPRCDRGDARSM